MQGNGTENVQRSTKSGGGGHCSGDSGGRGKAGQAEKNSSKAGTSKGAEVNAGGSKSQGMSKSKSGKFQETSNKHGVAGWSGSVSKSRSRGGKSNSDLPQGLQTICKSMNKRPQGLHTQEDSSKSQSRSTGRKSRSRRAADAERIHNPWLSAAVAVGEGSLEDAMALEDFVVAQEERDYDSLLRSRYWSKMNPGSDAELECEAQTPQATAKPSKK